MLRHPSRLQTILLMLPTWAFAHAVLVFRVLTESIIFGTSAQLDRLFFVGLVALLLGLLALTASFVAARRAAVLGWKFPALIGLLIHVPFAGAGLALWLAASGEESAKDSASPTAVAGRLVVPFIRAATACGGLTWGFDKLADLGWIPFGLKQTGGYFGVAIFAGIPLATGESSGVISRRDGGPFGQAVGAGRRERGRAAGREKGESAAVDGSATIKDRTHSK